MIWIISGTKDSRDIVERILDFKNEKILVSTATEYGGKLFRNMNNNLIEIKYLHNISQNLNCYYFSIWAK